MQHNKVQQYFLVCVLMGTVVLAFSVQDPALPQLGGAGPLPDRPQALTPPEGRAGRPPSGKLLAAVAAGLHSRWAFYMSDMCGF